ncbi:sodium/calcium exchanger regulatory protein 1-like [Amphiura filiformis]|uniref:sodium/calcium exchanger regulatory protein 1-like n=1 Tax=Amphiura filiformis TaxID=82378 RepID=UPI003B20F550
MATKFVGHFKLHKSENFEPFMEALGVNIALRKIGNLASPELRVEQIDGDHFLVKEWTMVTKHQWDFTLGNEFQDKTVDGRDVKTTINFDGDCLVISEQPAGDTGSPVSFTWELVDENNIRITAKTKEVVAYRHFKRLES